MTPLLVSDCVSTVLIRVPDQMVPVSSSPMCDKHVAYESNIPHRTLADLRFFDPSDAAHYHVLAVEMPDDVSERYFIPTGWFANEDIVQIVRENFPEFAESLPLPNTPDGNWPKDGMYTVDNSSTSAEFSKFRSLETCIVDTVRSLQAVID